MQGGVGCAGSIVVGFGHHAAAKHQSRVVLSLVSPRCCRLKPLSFPLKLTFQAPYCCWRSIDFYGPTRNSVKGSQMDSWQITQEGAVTLHIMNPLPKFYLQFTSENRLKASSWSASSIILPLEHVQHRTWSCQKFHQVKEGASGNAFEQAGLPMMESKPVDTSQEPQELVGRCREKKLPKCRVFFGWLIQKLSVDTFFCLVDLFGSNNSHFW